MDSDFGYMDLLNGGSTLYEASCQSYDNAMYTVPCGGVRGGGGGGGGGGDELEDVDGERGYRRLQWTEEDNLRLISAWLNNSVDPVDGNAKKGEVYWRQVTTEFNENSPADRRRKPIHCKDHWGKMNRKIVLFNGMWCRLREVYVSGQSDDQLMYKTHDLYKSETKQTFTLVNLWRELRNQPKWNRFYVEESNLQNNDPINVDIEEGTRLEGSKAAKAKKKGKGKGTSDSSSSSLSHDDIQLYYESQALRASTADRMADVQLQFSNEKLAAAQARERAATATSEKAFMEKYMELVMANTTCMSDFQRMEHERALQFFRDKIMGAENINL